MKLNFNHISHSLLIGGSLLTASIAANAAETQSKIELAMYAPINGTPQYPIQTELSSEKMLMMADSLNTARMSSSQKNLEFALVYSAANKGSSEAQFRLANYYVEGDLVAEDETEASYWLEQAMEQGHQGAKFVYDNLYLAHNFDVGC